MRKFHPDGVDEREYKFVDVERKVLMGQYDAYGNSLETVIIDVYEDINGRLLLTAESILEKLSRATGVEMKFTGVVTAKPFKEV